VVLLKKSTLDFLKGAALKSKIVSDLSKNGTPKSR
jgi:hypothetical protein